MTTRDDEEDVEDVEAVNPVEASLWDVDAGDPALLEEDTDDEDDSDDEVDSELEEDDKAVESDEEAPVPATAEEAEFQKRFDEIAEKVRGHAPCTWCRRLVCPCCGLPFGWHG